MAVPIRPSPCLDFVIQIERAGEGQYTAEAHGPSGEARTTFALPFDEKDLEMFPLRVGRPRQAGRGRVPPRR